MKFRKSLAVLLSVIMALAVLTPLAYASGTQDLPIIRICGMDGDCYNKDGVIISDKPDLAEIFGDKEMMTPVIAKLGISAVSGDWKPFGDAIGDVLVKYLSAVALNKDGEPNEGDYYVAPSGNFSKGWTQADIEERCKTKSSDFGYGDFQYSYDWRIDFNDLIGDVHDFIKAVLKYTGAKQVNLVAISFGAALAEAYLIRYGSERLVNTFVPYVPAIGGASALNTIFSDSISIDPDDVERFVNFYFTKDSDGKKLFEGQEELLSLLTAGVALANQIKLLGYGTDVIEKFWYCFSKYALPRAIRESYGTCPSYWEIISPEYYEKSKKFVFGGYEDEYAGLIEKIDTYYRDVSSHHTENFEKFHDEYGIKTAIICHYGFVNYPFVDDVGEPNDNLCSVRCQSLGATVGTYSKPLSDGYIAQAKQNGTYKYISPDRLIDLSTAAIPDRTWVICNANHTSGHDCVKDFIVKICRNVDETTVDTFPEYPQYMVYDENAKTLIPMPDDFKDYVHLEKDKSPFAPLKALFVFIKELFIFIKDFIGSKLK